MRRHRAALLLFAALLAGAHPLAATAQSVAGCDAPSANARNIYPPYAVTIREFADGAVRVIALDTVEPAAAAFHVMITHVAADEPFPLCTLISASADLGFSGLDMAALTGREDPARGLILDLPVQQLVGGDAQARAALELTVDRASGVVIAVLQASTPGPVGGQK